MKNKNIFHKLTPKVKVFLKFSKIISKEIILENSKISKDIHKIFNN
jgi:hypothetical protein